MKIGYIKFKRKKNPNNIKIIAIFPFLLLFADSLREHRKILTFNA